MDLDMLIHYLTQLREMYGNVETVLFDSMEEVLQSSIGSVEFDDVDGPSIFLKAEE